ncbi:DUF4240 domain-containing protein [Streptomyces sp. NPDC004542]|uniref:DUF4240 domain-containing protein n=1 Tax=Streptomyces sp. NPDC004542 TaxID=3154281 RepID=UPI0033B9CC74
MNKDQFWKAICELDGYADDESVYDLRELLLGEDAEDVAAFQVLLDEQLAVLSARAAEAGVELDEAEACAVVAAGREAYEAVLADPAEFGRRDWDTEDALALRETAADVLEFLGGLPDFAEGDEWLHVSFGSDFTIPSAYENAVESLAESIDRSPEWRRWWQGAESPRLFVFLELMKSPELREPPHLRRRRESVEFSMSIDPQNVRGLRLPGRGGKASEVARGDLMACLNRVAEELSLESVPPLP